MKVMLVAVPLMEMHDGELVPISMDRIKSSPPLGVYWLGGVARRAGHEIDVLDLIALGRVDVPLILRRAGKADIVGISCNTLNWPTARIVAQHIKQAYPELPLIVGGIHPSSYPEHVLHSCPADYIVRGEGERPLVALLEALEGKRGLDTVPGLGYWHEGVIRLNPDLGLASIDEVENLPDPAYDLLPAEIYETLSIESARGCKFKCTFCSTKFLGSWRGVSAENFVNRLERLMPYVERTRYGVFSFIDDLYTLDIERVPRITELILQRGLKVEATLDARATDIIRGRVAEALAPITNHMLIGAECGYDEGLKKIAKGCTTQVLERAAAILNDVGLSRQVVFSFVIGFPFETRDDCLKTIEFASNLLVKHNVRIYLQWYNTIPGSILWDELAAKGLVNIGMYDDFGFFSNPYLFRSGVQLPIDEIKELSEIIQSLNTVLLFTQPADDIIQFAPPEWLWSNDTVNFPSHGVLKDGVRPESPPRLKHSDVAGLVGLHREPDKRRLPMLRPDGC
ncbi:MAG: radical SAM protein [Luteitalea sp.]|nr:radical SAM protein [Luteitalea sp.]